MQENTIINFGNVDKGLKQSQNQEEQNSINANFLIKSEYSERSIQEYGNEDQDEDEDEQENQIEDQEQQSQLNQEQENNRSQSSDRIQRRGRPQINKDKLGLQPKFYTVIWQAQLQYMFEVSDKKRKIGFASKIPVVHKLQEVIPQKYRSVWEELLRRSQDIKVVKLLDMLTKLTFGKQRKYIDEFFQLYLRTNNKDYLKQQKNTIAGLQNISMQLLKIPTPSIREFEIISEKDNENIKYRRLLKAICYSILATYCEDQEIQDLYNR